MRITGKEVAVFVARIHGLTFEELIAPRRTWAYARPRQIAMWGIRQVSPHMSLPAIGRLLGGRDHTTVISGIRRIELLRQHDDNINDACEALIGWAEAKSALSPTPGNHARICAAEASLAAVLGDLQAMTRGALAA